MNSNRIFRLLICLLVVCCLIIQVSPIRAHAVEPISASLALGYAAILILMTCGVVFVTETADEVIAIGKSMTRSLYQWGTSANKLDEVEDWISTIKIYDNALGGDDDSPKDYKVVLARGILAGIAAWVCSVILATTDVEVEEEAEVGFAYYNGVLLPDIDLVWTEKETYRYACLTYNSISGYSSLCISTDPFYYDSIGDWRYTYCSSSEYISCQSYFSYSNGQHTTWTKSTSYYYSGWHKLGGGLPHWTNHQVLDYHNRTVVLLEATEPVDFLTTILYPETYVGDIPQKVQDGELDEETLVLPDINYGALIKDGLTLEQSLQNTMQQLKDGTMTYEEFMEQIKVEEETETDPDPSEDPSEDPTTSVDGSSTDPTAYALDLSNYFPFCIPFDLYDFLACLNADPVTPVIEWELVLPGGSTYPIELDLSPFDSVAKLLRRLQLLVFIIGLAFKTRDLIKG